MTKNNWFTVNPYNAETLQNWDWADTQQIDSVVAELDKGFLVWRKFTLAERKKKLESLPLFFKTHRRDIARQMTLEMGKPLSQALIEVDKMASSMAYYFTTLSEDHFILNVSTEPGYRHHITRAPLGIIWGVMPWNFPLWQAFRMFFPCLLAGNTVLLKSSEITPSMGVWLQKAFDSLDTPIIFRHLMTHHKDSEALLSDRRICGLSFTGSTQAGRTLGALAGKHIKKSILELGGSDPYLVFPDTDIKLAAQKIIAARMNNTGQVCISAKRALVHQSILDDFLNSASHEMAAWNFGDPLLRTTHFGPLAHQKFAIHYQQQCQQLESVSDLVFEKKLSTTSLAAVSPRLVLVREPRASFLKQTEIFGPCLQVYSFQDVDEAIGLANSTDFGLGAGLFTNAPEIKQRALEIRVGTIAINDTVKSRVEIPFGGWGQSGYGIELGEWGFAEFTQSQVISEPTGD